MDLGMKFELEYEDGDYEIYRSTNHADQSRRARIFVDHALCENAAHGAVIYDENDDEIARKFFIEWEDAQRWLESEVAHVVYPGPLSEGFSPHVR